MLLTEYDKKLHLKNVYREGREEGYSEGQEEASDRINKLTILLIEEGRTEELIKAARDSAYQKKLLEQYHL